MDFITQSLEYFHKGGMVMYFLLLCSFLVIIIGVERFLYFREMDSGRSFAKEYCRKLRLEGWQAAAGFAKESTGECARILAAAMNRGQVKRDVMASFLESESGVAIAGLRSRLYYLNVIITLSPLLGLLGTIIGMIASFSIFHLQAGEPLAITGGIAEALIATATGLCVAIAALAVHAYFVQRTDTAITAMERCFSVFMEAFDQGGERA